MKNQWLKNITYYFSVLSGPRINIRLYLLISVVTGLLIPLANVLFPQIIVTCFTGAFFARAALAPVAQVLLVVGVFFIVTTLALTIKAYIDKKINWYGPYLQFKMREGIQYRAMTMDFPLTEDKDALNQYTSAENAATQAENIFRYVCGVLSSCILVLIYSILICRLHPVLLLLLAFNAFIGYKLTVKAKLYDASLREARAEADRRKSYLYQTMFDYGFGKETRLFSFYTLLTDKFKEQRNRKKGIATRSEDKAMSRWQ